MPFLCRTSYCTALALTLFCAFFFLGRADASSAPQITITINDAVITQLLHLIETHDDSDASIDAWVNLPGNAELLKIGAAENLMTPDQLHANAKAVIDGTATDATQPKYSFGRVLMSPQSDYHAMIAALEQQESTWLPLCEARDTLYCPDNVNIQQTVYLHLGGDWDAINRDGAIYINMAFFHDYFKPSWNGINLLISHETFHAVQNATFGNPESVQNSDAAFYTALSKIQREGTARYVEVNADADGYSPNTYGFFYRAVDNETIRDFPIAMSRLASLTSACYPDLDTDAYTHEVSTGLGNGGPYYTIGEGMATAIETYDNRKRLIETVQKGPLDFFQCYADIAKHHKELPKIPQEAYKRLETLRKLAKNDRIDITAQQSGGDFVKH